MSPAIDIDPRPPWYDQHKDILFHRVGDQELRLDLYVPLKAPSPSATILYLHGGGWRNGSKDGCPAESLVSDGFAVACANYRLSGVAPFPAQVHDVRAAVRWLRGNGPRYKLATAKIGVFGLSAGAHLATMLGVASDVKGLEQKRGERAQGHQVQAVVAWFPPSDFLSVDYVLHQEYAGAVVQLLNLPNIQAIKEADAIPQAWLASPLYHVTGDDAPILLVHGTADKVVPVTQSIALHRALKKAGVGSVLRQLPGATHGSGFGQAQEIEVRDFFRKHLRDGEAVKSKTPTKPTR